VHMSDGRIESDQLNGGSQHGSTTHPALGAAGAR
jgi:hypothetical protein